MSIDYKVGQIVVCTSRNNTWGFVFDKKYRITNVDYVSVRLGSVIEGSAVCPNEWSGVMNLWIPRHSVKPCTLQVGEYNQETGERGLVNEESN